MKSIFKYAICALFAGLTLTACSPEEYEGANGQVPDASQYADMFTVTVDQETNTATFTFTETQGVTPVWRVDGESYSSSTTFTKYWSTSLTAMLRTVTVCARNQSERLLL